MSFLRLTKIFGVGLLGYEVLVTIFGFGWAVFSPRSMVAYFDASLRTSIELLLLYFGGIGFVVAVALLPGIWCILKLRPRNEN